jgi:2-polyprenyl-3-methyl-5-hydroxy-6-metoxy-1,4-benzoquinol methylase
MTSLNLTLDAIFHETIGRNQAWLEVYDELYNLPRLQYLQHTCAQTISYIEKKSWFIILVLYTNDGEVYVEHDGSSRWLLWGSIKCNEQIHDAIQRITQRAHPDIKISDVCPINLIDNTFCHKDHAATLHGIVFAARIRNKSCVEDTLQWGTFPITDDLIQSIHKYGNKDVLQYFYSNIMPKLVLYSSDMQEEEILINEQMQLRYKIHGIRGKPLLRLFGINKNYIIKDWIIEQCRDEQKIIDVSCGEDNLVRCIAQGSNKIVIGNDISRSQIWITPHHLSNLIYTNHNAANLPFKYRAFDVAICKNTLHHMPHRLQLTQLLASMKKIAKKMIFVEIENPEVTGWIPWKIHKHLYRGFLKDAWGAYIDQIQFTDLMQAVYSKTHTIETGIFKTPQGNYFRAVVAPL